MSRFSPAIRPTNIISTSTVSNWFGNQFILIPGSYDSIATVSAASGGSATLEITNIPSTYSHLQLRMIAKLTTAGSGSSYGYIEANGDTTASNYRNHELYATGSGTPTSYGFNTLAGFTIQRFPFAGLTDQVGVGILDIFDYANTNKYKTSRYIGGTYSSDSYRQLHLDGCVWKNTNAITSLKFYPGSGSWAQYTQFALYGIKGA